MKVLASTPKKISVPAQSRPQKKYNIPLIDEGPSSSLVVGKNSVQVSLDADVAQSRDDER